MVLRLITYGCGEKFDVAKFNPIKNKFIKPSGGLWASPVDSRYGWREWCADNSFGDISSSFEFEFDGNVFVIDDTRAACRLPWIDLRDSKRPDFERVALLGYDAIWLTEDGERKTRFDEPSLYGWDCESVLIMNPSGILIPKGSN